MKDPSARERHWRIRCDRLNIEEGNCALCSVFPSIARCEIQILILPGIWYIRQGTVNRYIRFAVFQLGSKNIIIRSMNSVVGKGFLPVSSACLFQKERKFHLSVTSLLCQKLFLSGSSNNPDVKLNGDIIISKFRRLPTIRNRIPETFYIL